eukprot:11053099-Lingulodinium_polyedra.AAC.1
MNGTQALLTAANNGWRTAAMLEPVCLETPDLHWSRAAAVCRGAAEVAETRGREELARACREFAWAAR